MTHKRGKRGIYPGIGEREVYIHRYIHRYIQRYILIRGVREDTSQGQHAKICGGRQGHVRAERLKEGNRIRIMHYGHLGPVYIPTAAPVRRPSLRPGALTPWEEGRADTTQA